MYINKAKLNEFNLCFCFRPILNVFACRSHLFDSYTLITVTNKFQVPTE